MKNLDAQCVFFSPKFSKGTRYFSPKNLMHMLFFINFLKLKWVMNLIATGTKELYIPKKNLCQKTSFFLKNGILKSL